MQWYWVLTKAVAFGYRSALVMAFVRFRGVRNAITGAVGAFLRQSHPGSDFSPHRVCSQKALSVNFYAAPAGLCSGESSSESGTGPVETRSSLSFLLWAPVA